jgi:ornithine cyclodeaminase/alanine dehydrogenase-like protein (mu-crystallin family)
MALFLSTEDVLALASDEIVLSAARAAVRAERDGQVVQPPRMDVEVDNGFLRVMPAAVDSAMGVKVMTLAEEIGTRYLILLYGAEDGELRAALDADEITRLRTAATTVVAGDMLQSGPPRRIGLLGSGFEAEGHLRLMARVWPLEEVAVFSPNAARRTAFAERMSAALWIDVAAVESCAAACEGASTVVLTTKSREPVVAGGDFAPGAVVLSIGSTRPPLRELDRDTLLRAGTLLVDDPRQVTSESGDIIDALTSSALDAERIVSMGAAAADPSRIRREGERDLLVFKSVGTAVSDLALASRLVEEAERTDRGRDVGELARLKRFGNAAVRATSGPASTAER